jgi:hypothetical protein
MNLNFVINSKVLQDNGFSLRDFSILLYYISGEERDIHPEISKSLWERGYLIKTLLGYQYNPHITEDLIFWVSESKRVSDKKPKRDVTSLAERLRDLFPSGKKDKALNWKGSQKAIEQRLTLFFNKFGTEYTDDEIVDCTRKYIASFNGNYTYMRVLKYFIMKQVDGTNLMESTLYELLENKDEDSPCENSDWTQTLI